LNLQDPISFQITSQVLEISID